MLRAQRLREIVRRTEVQGSIRAAELARELGVDVSTVRRDLAHLGRTGLVERARGGALRAEPGRTIDIPYDLKRSVELDAKTAIGKAAAERVRVGETILIDSGSTTFQMLPWLRQRRGITVVTNDLHIAHWLARVPGVRLIVTGGILLDGVYTLVGPQALAALEELHVDHTFLGADAIDREAGITNVNMVEVAVKRAMIAAATRTSVLADSTKFEHRALARVAGLDEVTEIITDDRLPPGTRSRYRELPITFVRLAAAGGTRSESA